MKRKDKYIHVRDQIDKPREPRCQYYIWFGERSSGKTYSAIEYGLDEYLKGNGATTYIRRWEEDIKGSKGSELLKNHVPLIVKFSHGKFNSYRYYQRKFFLVHLDDEGKVDLADKNPFCYSLALTQQEHYKSVPFNDVRTIILDEFIGRTYLPDEFVTFQNLLSTIIRDRNDVLILMLGNSINKYCPYFNEMGLDRVKTMQQGETHIYEYGSSNLRVSVTYTGSNEEDKKPRKKSDVYFAFNNPKLKMISEGLWEIDIYPHLPYRYLPKDVIYKFFVIFDRETLQCNVISHDDDLFVFVHRKTTEVKARDGELVYQQTQDPRPNYRVRLNKPSNKIESWVVSFFQRDKVFYQSNEVGEIMRNYLNWCLKH